MNYLQRKKRAIISAKQQGILPSGYKLCEYLESTGKEYINLGIKPDSDYGYRIIETLKYIADHHPVGAYDGINYHCSIGQWNSWHWYMRWKNTLYIPGGGGALNETYDLRTNYYNNKILVVNDVTKHSGLLTFSQVSQDIYLFGWNNNGVLDSHPMRILLCEITYKNELLMNLLPCLDNNNRPCMYDTVSKQTFYNQGTGEFLYGEVIN